MINPGKLDDVETLVLKMFSHLIIFEFLYI